MLILYYTLILGFLRLWLVSVSSLRLFLSSPLMMPICHCYCWYILRHIFMLIRQVVAGHYCHYMPLLHSIFFFFHYAAAFGHTHISFSCRFFRCHYCHNSCHYATADIDADFRHCRRLPITTPHAIGHWLPLLMSLMSLTQLITLAFHWLGFRWALMGFRAWLSLSDISQLSCWLSLSPLLIIADAIFAIIGQLLADTDEGYAAKILPLMLILLIIDAMPLLP